MPDFDFHTVSAEALNEVCSRSLYTVDGLWFLAVEEKFGFETTFKLNQEVWEKASLIHGRRLLKKLDLKGKPPLQSLVEMLLNDPMMFVHRPEVPTLTDTRAVFRCIDCPVQVARIRDGRGVYDGKPACSILFKTYAGLINPGIEVTCLACAPNPENPDYWCEWEFIVTGDKGNGR